MLANKKYTFLKDLPENVVALAQRDHLNFVRDTGKYTPSQAVQLVDDLPNKNIEELKGLVDDGMYHFLYSLQHGTITEQYYIFYDALDDEEDVNEFSVMTFEQIRQWLYDHWENNPNEEDEEEEQAELLEDIQATTCPSELYERLAGVGYAMEEIDIFYKSEIASDSEVYAGLKESTKLNVYDYENGDTEIIVIEVPTYWLTIKIREIAKMDLQTFLDSYECDTIDWLHELAQKEEQILSVENGIVELDDYKFRENYLSDALEHFNISLDELKEISDKQDLKVYPSYRNFFKTYFENTYDTMEQLIDLMYEGNTEPPGKDYFILKNGEVIHIYP